MTFKKVLFYMKHLMKGLKTWPCHERTGIEHLTEGDLWWNDGETCENSNGKGNVAFCYKGLGEI